ncbi:MAG: tail fiber protein [Desulfobaccales bacterium]|jgi:microcystin-dependent protein
MKKLTAFLLVFCLFTFNFCLASQYPLVVPDGTGAQVRAGFNNALDSLNTINSGPSAPTTTEPYMLWADTTNNLLKQMNSTNTAWIVLGTLGAANLGLELAITPGTTSQYWRGDKTWQTLPPSLSYPGAGVPLSTGSAWGTSYTVGTGANDLVQLNSSGQLPAVSGALLTNLPTTGMVYPGAGVPNSTGSAWGTSYTVGTTANNLVQLNSSGQLPAVDGSLLTNLAAASIPPGVIVPYAGASAPSGWLLCYGQQVSTTTYASLYGAIGTTYGSGSGTFGIPDLRGRAAFGADAMGGTAAGRLGSGNTGGITGSATLGASGGQQSHTLTSAEEASMPVTGTLATGTGGGGSNAVIQDNVNTALIQSGQFTAITALNGITGTATGGGGAHNITPPALVLNYIIKY